MQPPLEGAAAAGGGGGASTENVCTLPVAVEGGVDVPSGGVWPARWFCGCGGLKCGSATVVTSRLVPHLPIWEGAAPVGGVAPSMGGDAPVPEAAAAPAADGGVADPPEQAAGQLPQVN